MRHVRVPELGRFDLREELLDAPVSCIDVDIECHGLLRPWRTGDDSEPLFLVLAKLRWPYPPSHRLLGIIGVDLSVTVEAKRYPVLLGVVATFASRNDVMNLHLAARQLVAQAAMPVARHEQPLGNIRRKSHLSPLPGFRSLRGGQPSLHPSACR